MEDGNEAALRAVAAKLQEFDAVGRYSTWGAPIAMTNTEVAVEYARAFIAGEVTDRNDADLLLKLFNEGVPGASVKTYTDADGKEYGNFYTVRLGSVDFNNYL